MSEEQNPQPGNGPQKAPEQTPPRADLPGGMSARTRSLLAWALVLAMVLMMVQFGMRRQDPVEVIKYNPEFRGYVQAGRVKTCEIVQDVSGVVFIRGELKPATVEKPAEGEKLDKSKTTKFKVFITAADEDLKRFLEANNVEFSVPPQNPLLWQIASSVLPVVLIFGLLYFLVMRQMRAAGQGAMSFGKSRARLLNRDSHKMTFENVAGIDEAKDEVQEIIEFLKDPKRFRNLGGRIPKGVLLVGPPGTGKTLLAKAIAGEANVPFFSISGSDFVEMFVGVGASRVRDMFEQGKKNAPCIMFIDEIDAVGRSRFTGIGGGHDEREQTLNALLVQMDGFETQEGVIILAATNRPDVLDMALLRPGRFDRQIVIDLPTIEGRVAILAMHARKIKLAEGVDLRVIARGTPGFSGADLANLLNEAALLAAKNNKAGVDLKDLEEARDKVKWGRERRGRVLDDKEKRITAYHEAGHALVMQLIKESVPLHKLTIIPRGVAYLGATMQLPEKDVYVQGRKELLAILAGLMGGRSAEELFFDDITSGAASDLKEATRIARLMVCTWGMSESMGPQAFGEHHELLFLGRDMQRTQDYSEETSRRIDAEVNRLLREAHEKARDLITANRDKLTTVAEMLLEHETIDGRDVMEIVLQGRILSEAERADVDRAKQQAEAEKDAAKKPTAEAAAAPAAEAAPAASV